MSTFPPHRNPEQAVVSLGAEQSLEAIAALEATGRPSDKELAGSIRRVLTRQGVRLKSPNAAEEMQTILDDGECDLSDAEDAMGQTDCPEGCYVEPDGHCPHGYESAGLTLGVI